MVLFTKLLIIVAAAAVVAFPPRRAADHADVVPGKYIVTLKGDADVESHIAWVKSLHPRNSCSPHTKAVEKVWTESFKGYSGEFDEATLKQITSREDVVGIEPHNCPWGLISLSHREPDGRRYDYWGSAGEGTWVYVLDTGIYTENLDFEGRAHLGYNAIPSIPFEDTNGHGTHCAGTIIGKRFGVAKNAQAIAVKVLDGDSGDTATVIDGLEWAVSNITKTPGRAANAVVSMSLGGPYSLALNTAVKNAYHAGVLSVVAAGNSGLPAELFSPASESTAITVAAIDVSRRKAGFANFGASVDVFAAGVDVESAYIGAPDAFAALSGTSMATSYIAGLALYLKRLEYGTESPGGVTARIQELATRDVVQESGPLTPNLLAYNNFPAQGPCPGCG
ncbi:peptidase S8/S53 domain-containing protein [Emericellopsis atlantica]|uniref:Peptidase S8/S53 domain-containing protein n=1 Tax=Emericellopsis atlantica TaxID=2614577 RepID=A0A9P7ZH12_9HYPO|nr:peptidase S8/S53 domain-containing protein [Emericellopsis atlantica]KAG9251662.1 peptidase S8/S53 domain-containing protein [Emericellopsis atlantica]